MRSKSSIHVALVLALASFQSEAIAQGATPQARTDSMFLRARELVAEGNGAAGRALVDSILGAEKEGTASYSEALFWRAALAETAASAQQDYLRLSIEYSTTPRAPEALLRLAQLEVARGNNEQAVRHLDRLARDYPSSPLAAQGLYWHGRVLLENRAPDKVAAACASLQKAQAMADVGDAELRNQIAFYSQRCPPPAVVNSTPGNTPPATPPAAAAESTSAPKVPAARDHGRFAVQVAAYARQSDAENAAARFRRRGMEARVVEGPNVHRVWIGRYGTRTQATAVLQELRKSGVEGFVTEEK